MRCESDIGLDLDQILFIVLEGLWKRRMRTLWIGWPLTYEAAFRQPVV